MSADAYRDDAPRTLSEALSDEYNTTTWFPTGPAGSALAALTGTVNRQAPEVDNPQH
jgi:hypothetical protein